MLKSNFRILNLAAGAVLLVGSALKGHQLATSPVDGVRSGLMLLVLAEWILGMALVSGIWPRQMGLIAAVCFGCFFVFTGYKVWQHADSCGCFGRVLVKPIYTMFMDLVFFIAFCFWRRNVVAGTTLKRLVLAGVFTLITSGLWLWAMRTYTPAGVNALGQVVGDDPNVILVPETWAGKPVPLRDQIENSDALAKGNWLILFYHHDCPDCQATLRTLTARPAGAGTKLALVEVPPYGELPWGTIAHGEGLIRMRLSDQRNWFLATPTLLSANDNVVKSVLVQERILSDGKPTPALQSLADDLAGKPVVPASNPIDIHDASTPPASVPASQPADISNVEHDFGIVRIGQIYDYDLVLENPDPQRLEITYTRGECKCLLVAPIPTGIPAHGSITLRVSFKPDMTGTYSKRIVFLTASKERPVIVFRGIANVR